MPYNMNQKERLAEIYNEMTHLLDEAMTIVRQSGNRRDLERAKEMWAGYISTGLNGSEGYSFVTSDKHTFLACLQDLGYNEDTESFEDEEDEDEEV